jgi:hypothetical protein
MLPYVQQRNLELIYRELLRVIPANQGLLQKVYGIRREALRELNSIIGKGLGYTTELIARDTIGRMRTPWCASCFPL